MLQENKFYDLLTEKTELLNILNKETTEAT